MEKMADVTNARMRHVALICMGAELRYVTLFLKTLCDTLASRVGLSGHRRDRAREGLPAAADGVHARLPLHESVFKNGFM